MINALADRLSERIRREGPITFHDWMQAALYDEQLGYYLRPDLPRWGKNGDYRTSPEINVLFAATFARYFGKTFLDLGSPSPFTIVEVGAGSGQFAEQVLDCLRLRSPEIFAQLNYVIDELSPDARMRATTKLARFRDQVQFNHLTQLNIDGGIIFSNELIDAFPVHRVELQQGTLSEFYVGLDDREDFVWLKGPLSSPRLLAYLERFAVPLQEHQILEINLRLEDWYRAVAGSLQRGYMVTVDYGSEADQLYDPTLRVQGTLRAFQRHTFRDNVLANPGEQDLTSTINWTAMKDFGQEVGFRLVEFESQDHFLLNHGLLEELELLVGEADSVSERVQLRTSAREMILPGTMASSFQVLVQQI
jgi:SAM-dependent MidA family methyltransferase